VADILGRFGLTRVINATGTVTRLGASPLDAEVIDAMAAAARCSVDIAELQGRACETIAQYTGAQAGIVTSGAMAGLLVGAAACIAGLDPDKMARLPDTRGMRNEFIVARSHRNSYDHGVRAAGARLIEVGLPDRITGCGVRDTEAWEYESAIGPQTAGILFLARADARPRLPDVVRIAQAAAIPVLVDAAAELPPRGNLRRFIEEGADLVAFSGGKSIGGPSASGILCGRKQLIASALLQQLDLDYVSEDWQPPSQLIDRGALRGVPRHGIGRSCKVGKEQIVGLLTALERFAGEDDAARNARFAIVADALLQRLSPLTGLRVQRVKDGTVRADNFAPYAISGWCGWRPCAIRRSRPIHPC
jgi:L-seryl-tRNA(Ser) seleniumtransferase